eukprot:COSAG04_NODE_1692_length_5913_cov_7.400241_4_plen_242_part_00
MTHHARPGPRQPDHYNPSASTFPTPPPQGTPLAAQRPPQQAPHPPAGCPAWAPGAQAGQARSRRSLGGAPVRPRQPTTRACHLPPPTARLQAAGPGAFRCSRLLVCHAPPTLAALRATNWGHVGCRWVGPAEQASGPPCSRSCGPRSTCAWPGWCLWATHSRSCFSASLPAVPSPLCTGSAPFVGLAGALVRSGGTELGRGYAGWGGEALARSCAAHVVGSRVDCPHGWGGGRATMCKGRR